jgi:hypothetical protein
VRLLGAKEWGVGARAIVNKKDSAVTLRRDGRGTVEAHAVWCRGCICGVVPWMCVQ